MSAKYHPGEIEVQERAGVRGMAERVGNGIHPVIPPAAREFLEEQPMVVVGSVGSDGRVWASMLAGEPGFARALDERTVMIDAAPVPGDPLAENLAAGVTAVGVVNFLPLDEGTGSWRLRTDGMTKDAGTRVKLNITGGDYFQAMGIALLQGRAFTAAEAVSPNTSVIVSRSAAARLWPGANPLGQRLRRTSTEEGEPWFTVVGVVDDVRHADWREAGVETLYLPLTGATPDMWGVGSPAYVVKTPRAELLQREVRELVRALAPEAPVYREQTMAVVARRSMIQLSFTMLTLGVVSGLALLLGAVGLYGVLSYVVAERRREIGVRMALGARARTVRRMVVAQGVRVVLIGVGIGVVVALASTRLLGALLYDVRAVDPLVFAAMSLMMLAVGALASWVPARRASGVNPIESLRSE